MCRRDLFKVGLGDTYKAICGSKKPVGLELLGDDLTDRLATTGNAKRSILGPLIQPRAFFISSPGESPPGIPPKKKQLPVKSRRQPECEQHLQGEEICDTEVTPEAVSQMPLLSVTGEKTCPPVVAGRIQHFLGKWKQHMTPAS